MADGRDLDQTHRRRGDDQVLQEQDRLVGVISLRDVMSVFLPDQVHEQ